jgi:hypothetical protein
MGNRINERIGVVTYISGIQMARSKHPIPMVDFVGGSSKVPFSNPSLVVVVSMVKAKGE